SKKRLRTQYRVMKVYTRCSLRDSTRSSSSPSTTVIAIWSHSMACFNIRYRLFERTSWKGRSANLRRARPKESEWASSASKECKERPQRRLKDVQENRLFGASSSGGGDADEPGSRPGGCGRVRGGCRTGLLRCGLSVWLCALPLWVRLRVLRLSILLWLPLLLSVCRIWLLGWRLVRPWIRLPRRIRLRWSRLWIRRSRLWIRWSWIRGRVRPRWVRRRLRPWRWVWWRRCSWQLWRRP